MKVIGLDNPESDSSMVSRCPTPCILMLKTGMNSTQQFYGAFANGDVAHEWISRQPSYLRFMLIPLRHIDRDRQTQDDWYFPDRDGTEIDFDPPSVVRSQQ